MIRGAAAALALTVAGCSVEQPAGQPPAPSASAQAPSPTSSPAPAPSPTRSAADGTDVRACFDGTCEITVTGKKRIPLTTKLGVSGLTVSVAGPSKVQVASDDGMMRAGGGPGARLGLNGLLVEVIEVRDGTALLRMSGQRR
ncbi:hypothetical protein [Actinoplanes auranticolor]|uniref:hypothetical protein n=1 Tax=Actinoplanes auranticolor TaxID=47988 RepID=UPI001BB3DB8B|nr:hypothetical protein [Actinoplanes auranticolor]